MGYWRLKKSVDPECWGDQPADIMSDALDKIFKVFKEDVGRIPTKFELEEGLKFSIGGSTEYDED